MSFGEQTRFPVVDVRALTREVGVEFEPLRDELMHYYAEIDAHNDHNTAALALPCRRGCSECCNESVFLTPLEFLVVWDYVQANVGAAERDAVIASGLALYEQHQAAIVAFDAPPPEGERDHFSIARDLHYRCPLLGSEGECLAYPARELAARLFGASFNAAGGVYGCMLVGQHLAGQTVTLVSAERAAAALKDLPFGNKRQVYPYFIHMLYTDPNVPVVAAGQG